ncbi:MAG TPA: protein-L-isoaspartate O-methyltransferase [Stellaceae bacterium]|nr:protein-L-isoaspartate O-methyltransferase [Stellaceae bacterium]
MTDYQAARLNMVESQIRPNKVTDPALLEAMLAVPRELFVPSHLRGIAYIDEDIPLGNGRFLMEPMVLGRLLQLAALGPADAVLEIGCGSGYASALMARLAHHVVALEEDSRLAAQAADAFRQLGLKNVSLVHGPLADGYPQRAPYQAILFGGAVATVPPAISAQLAEGGRLLAVLKKGEGMGKGILMTRTGGGLGHRVIFDAGTPFLPGFAPQPSFVF